MDRKLNLGAGKSKYPGFINIDIIEEFKPDVVCNIKNNFLPFKSNSIDEVRMIHVIEHIEYQYQGSLFEEIYRILKPLGEMILMYPEFSECAKHFNENFRGMKEYWRMTLYGRQRDFADYHVTPMDTIDLTNWLRQIGFFGIVAIPCAGEEFNTALKAYKSRLPLPDRDELLRREIFSC